MLAVEDRGEFSTRWSSLLGSAWPGFLRTLVTKTEPSSPSENAKLLSIPCSGQCPITIRVKTTEYQKALGSCYGNRSKLDQHSASFGSKASSLSEARGGSSLQASIQLNTNNNSQGNAHVSPTRTTTQATQLETQGVIIRLPYQ